MRILIAPMCIVLMFGCERKEKETRDAKPPVSSVALFGTPMMPQMGVGSAAFHLEIGGVYERFQDPKSAVEHFSQGVERAENAAQRIQCYSALARVKEGLGDRDGAIAALEQANLETGKVPSAGGAQPPGAGLGGDDVVVRLARLYSQTGNNARAERLYESALSAAPKEPWQYEQVLRAAVQFYRSMGTLDEKVAEKEKVLETAQGDEPALRFLMVALGGNVNPMGGMIGGAMGQNGVVSDKLIRVYELLSKIHPDDRQLQQSLRVQLERGGRVDEAIQLARAASAKQGVVSPTECASAYSAIPFSPQLEGIAEAVRIRARAGQQNEALAEARTLESAAKKEGVAAYLLASQLYLELGRSEAANRLVEKAAEGAKSRDELRQVAFAKERAARGLNLRSLYDEWKKSDDVCLRLAAAQRELVPTATPPMMPPPSLLPGPP